MVVYILPCLTQSYSTHLKSDIKFSMVDEHPDHMPSEKFHGVDNFINAITKPKCASKEMELVHNRLSKLILVTQ